MKVNFSLFQNNGEKAAEVTFRKYSGKGADGTPLFEQVRADYRITNSDKSAVGSAIKDKSKAGNAVIRINFGLKSEGGTVYYNGTLNMTKSKKSESSPDMFGTASTKEGVEMDLACWFKQDKNGHKYLSCVMQEPRAKTEGVTEAAVGADDDEIPF